MLSLLTLSQDFVAAAAPDVSTYYVVGSLLRTVYKWTFMALIPFFIPGYQHDDVQLSALQIETCPPPL